MARMTRAQKPRSKFGQYKIAQQVKMWVQVTEKNHKSCRCMVHLALSTGIAYTNSVLMLTVRVNTLVFVLNFTIVLASQRVLEC